MTTETTKRRRRRPSDPAVRGRGVAKPRGAASRLARALEAVDVNASPAANEDLEAAAEASALDRAAGSHRGIRMHLRSAECTVCTPLHPPPSECTVTSSIRLVESGGWPPAWC